MTVRLVPARPAGQPESVGATLGAIDASALAWKAVGWLLEEHAEEYDAVSTSTRWVDLPLEGLGDVELFGTHSRDYLLKTGSIILCVRTFEAEGELRDATRGPVAGLPTWDDDVADGGSAEGQWFDSTTAFRDVVTQAALDADLNLDVSALEDALTEMAAGQDRVLSFGAVVAVRPYENDGRAMRFELLAYGYPVLKARNFFLDWFGLGETESRLNVALTGPRSDPSYSEGRYVAGAGFDVTWDREAAGDRQSPVWVSEPKGRVLSTFFETPNRVGPLLLRGTLHESSDIREQLEDLAELAEDQD